MAGMVFSEHFDVVERLQELERVGRRRSSQAEWQLSSRKYFKQFYYYLNI